MIKNSTQKMRLGQRLLFAIIWPIVIALLIHSRLLDGLFTGLNVDGATAAIGVIVLLPPAITLFPLAYRLDSIYSLKKKSARLPTWQRIAMGLLATALALWLLWYIYVLVSLGLTV